MSLSLQTLPGGDCTFPSSVGLTGIDSAILAPFSDQPSRHARRKQQAAKGPAHSSTRVIRKMRQRILFRHLNSVLRNFCLPIRMRICNENMMIHYMDSLQFSSSGDDVCVPTRFTPDALIVAPTQVGRVHVPFCDDAMQGVDWSIPGGAYEGGI